MKTLRFAILLGLMILGSGLVKAQHVIMLSVRDLAANYKLDSAYFSDTTPIINYLNSLPNADYPTLSAECNEIRNRVQSLLTSLSTEYERRDSLVWLDTNIAVSDFGVYELRLRNLVDYLSGLSARYVNLEKERIETEKRIARERAEAELRRQQQARNTRAANLREEIDMHHRSIGAACDGIGETNKAKVKELKDLHYAYLIVYNKYDLSEGQATDESIAQLEELSNFQNDLLVNCLGSDSYTSQIDNFKNVLKARCSKQNNDIYKSYSRVFKQTRVPISFANVEEYESYTNRLKAVIAIQNRYLQTIELREQIQSGEAAINAAYGKKYRDVVKSYAEAASNVDMVPSFTGSTESLQFIGNLEEFIEVQQIYVDNFQRLDDIRMRHDSSLKGHPERFADVVSAYREILPSLNTTPSFVNLVGARNYDDRLSEVELIQQCYIDVAERRSTIARNDKTITDGKKLDGRLYSGYRSIRKVTNLSPSFSSYERGRVFLGQLDEYISIQDRCINVLDIQDSIRAGETAINGHDHKYRNITKAYSRVAKSYRAITEIASTEDLRRYERECQLLLRIQNYFVEAISSPAGADIDSRLNKVKDVDKILLIVGVQ